MRTSLAFRFALTLCALSAATASARILTSADGRTIDVEVMGFEGTDKVVIKRADTGQTFTLPIDTFSERDRRALRAEAEEAAKKPQALPPGALAVELSRAKFDTRRQKQDIPLSNGTTRKDGITITEEDWGYTIALRNNTTRPLEGLRAEYILFVKVEQPGATKPDDRLRRSRGKIDFEAIPPSGRTTARSSAITARRTELASGIVWRGSGDTKSRDTLHGIWLRVYQGDALVLESASPGTLTATESW